MKKHIKLILLLALICAVGLLAAQKLYGVLERVAYPQKYSEYVEKYAAENNVSPKIVYAVIRTESSFSPKAQSNVDARGLMQITEETFAWIKSKIAPNESVTFDDLYDPATNIRFGAYLISYTLARYQNDLSTAAAAYHSGMGTVDTLLKNPDYSQDGAILTAFPYKQMNNYVSKINKSYQKYCTLYQL